jgi:AAA+ superfamily predicted ATPase
LSFIDELDAIFGQRGSPNSDKVSEEITNAFLAEFTGKEEGIWVIGATNRRDVIDDAILSRFGLEIELGLPDDRCRRAILDKELNECRIYGNGPCQRFESDARHVRVAIYPCWRSGLLQRENPEIFSP